MISSKISALALLTGLLLSQAPSWGAVTRTAPCTCCDTRTCSCDRGASNAPTCCCDDGPASADHESPAGDLSPRIDGPMAGWSSAGPTHLCDPLTGDVSRRHGPAAITAPATYLIACALRR